MTAGSGAKVAKEKGAKLFVITDAVTPTLQEAADGVIVVPAEGVSFFPSMTSGLATVQAIVAQLAVIDPARTRKTVGAADAQWHRFAILHRRTGPHRADGPGR